MGKENREAQFEMIAKTLYGLEDILARELLALGADNIETGRRMVRFTGDKELMYKANFHCRTALRILKYIHSFHAKDADEVYHRMKQIAWEEWMDEKHTFAVDTVVYSDAFTHSKFVAYRAKDAIADYFTEKHGKRPSVRIHRPDVLLHVHISHTDCTVLIDSSGESLHLRGYRKKQTEAPLNEVLAAGMVMRSGWNGQCNLIDPMCGSGTILIEAAMLALGIAPGIYRKEYAFERWPDFDADLLERIYNDERLERGFSFMCYGWDISPTAIAIAQENVRSAGLEKYISLSVQPMQQIKEVPPEGVLITNPPYGERLTVNDLSLLYGMIGERLKHAFTGYKAWILAHKTECFNCIGLHADSKFKMMNGPLECEFRGYELFAGKKGQGAKKR